MVVVAVVGGGLLVGSWVAHLRRDLRRRAARSADYDGVAGGTALWPSAAPWPACRARGALLSRGEGGLVHTCLSCGHRHVRAHRG